MLIKNKDGFVGVDMVLAITAILIFSVLIISLTYSNFSENIKTKMQALAIIHLTETLENVGIADYDDVTEENMDLLPKTIEDSSYTMKLGVEDYNSENVMKKVTATITYSLEDKNYEYSMERIKVKE